MNKAIPPLLKLNSFYFDGKMQDSMRVAINEMLEEHKDWDVNCTLKFNTLEIRSEEKS